MVEEINKGGGEAVGVATDVGDGASVKDMVARVARAFGGGGGGTAPVAVAAAVFNVSGPFVRKAFLELEAEELDRSYEGGV